MVLLVLPSANLNESEGTPSSVKIANCDPSLTVISAILIFILRSSSNAVGNPLAPSASGFPLVFALLNKLPFPLSKIVAVPVALIPPLFVAVNVKVSPAAGSSNESLVIATRTSKVPDTGVCTKSPGV